MPERSEYDDAMRFSKSRLRIQDEELKEGIVEMITLKNVLGSREIPWGNEGTFAVVYKFRTRSGKFRALRCFRVPIKPDTQFRYERIGPYFAQHLPAITAEFKYHNQGIMVKETILGQEQKKVYPVIEMEWVEGVTLLDYLDELCRKRDRTGLKDLADQWIILLQMIRRANIAHSDLSGGNVMVRPDGRLVLVDYDGVYIPEFAGFLPVVNGQVDYQHHQMNQRPFNERMDDFSLLVIYIALLALQVKPELWDKYTQRDTQNKLLNTNILFTQQDFVDAGRSSLINELERLGDQHIKAAAQELRRTCRQPIGQVRFPDQLIDPDFPKKQALSRLEQAIQNDEEEEIVRIWTVSALDNYDPAKKHLQRLSRAKQVMQYLKDFRDALQSGNIQQIVSAYNTSLDYSKSVMKEERDRLQFARSLAQAFQNDEDQAILSIYDDIQRLNYLGSYNFTPQETQQIAQAQRRKVALTKFQSALASKDISQIVNAYDFVLDQSKSIKPEERDLLRVVRKFSQAYKLDKDQDIITASEDIQQGGYQTKLLFTTAEQQRIKLAQDRRAVLAKFRIALKSKSIHEVVTGYSSVLDTSKDITTEERSQLQLALDFQKACDEDNEEAIVSANDKLQDQKQVFILTVREQETVVLAQKRKSALIRLRIALSRKRAQEIVTAADDPLLTTCKNMLPEEQEKLQLAREIVKAYRADRDDAILTLDNRLQQSPHQKSFSFTPEEKERVVLAQKRSTALTTYRTALQRPDLKAGEIVAAYDTILEDCKDLTPEEKTRLEAAQEFLKMYQTIITAIQDGRDDVIAAAYKEDLAQQFPEFTPAQQQRIRRTARKAELNEALRTNNYGKALRLAREIELAARRPIIDFKLTIARQQYARQFEVKDVEAQMFGNEVTVRWLWPEEDLIEDALILWRVDQQWPQHPSRGEEPNTGRVPVERRQGEKKGTKKFRLMYPMPVNLQIYLAIRDDSRRDAQGRPYTQWFYSNGSEPTSKKSVDPAWQSGIY